MESNWGRDLTLTSAFHTQRYTFVHTNTEERKGSLLSLWLMAAGLLQRWSLGDLWSFPNPPNVTLRRTSTTVISFLTYFFGKEKWSVATTDRRGNCHRCPRRNPAWPSFCSLEPYSCPLRWWAADCQSSASHQTLTLRVLSLGTFSLSVQPREAPAYSFT